MNHHESNFNSTKHIKVLLMEEILHRLIYEISDYLQGFVHLRLFGMISEPSTVSYTNEMK